MSNIREPLNDLALRVTIPFCLDCYKESDLEWCEVCGRDHLARLLPGRGITIGTDWVIESLLFRNLRSLAIARFWNVIYASRWGWLVAKIRSERLMSLDRKRYYRRSDVEHFLHSSQLD